MSAYRVIAEDCTALLALLKRNFAFDAADFRELEIGGYRLGLLTPRWAAQLTEDLPDLAVRRGNKVLLRCDDWTVCADLLQKTAALWCDRGILSGWRNEQFDVVSPDGAVLFALERTAFRPLGLLSTAVHVNGWRKVDGQTHFWIARRSPFKSVDPNKLDNVVGGGIVSGEAVADALAREGFEEAGLNDIQIRRSLPQGRMLSRRPVARGLHREYLYVFDLEIPEGEMPANQDGEVAAFELMPPAQVVAAMLEGRFMNDSLLVGADALLRFGMIDIHSDLGQWLLQCRREAP